MLLEEIGLEKDKIFAYPPKCCNQDSLLVTNKTEQSSIYDMAASFLMHAANDVAHACVFFKSIGKHWELFFPKDDGFQIITLKENVLPRSAFPTAVDSFGFEEYIVLFEVEKDSWKFITE